MAKIEILREKKKAEAREQWWFGLSAIIPALKLPNLIFIHSTNQKNPYIQLLKTKINHNLYLNSTIKQNPDLQKLKNQPALTNTKNNENPNTYQA